MKNLKGSQTEKNLYKTFAGESRARSKYSMFAEKAREEGYQWIGQIFDITAWNEFAHSREVFKRYLKNVGSTVDNLMNAAIGESDEFKNIYKEFEETARKEGYDEIADFYKELREVEEEHQKRFLDLYDKVINDAVFKSKKTIYWECLNCGYIHEGKEAPVICPLCKFPQAYFKPYYCAKDMDTKNISNINNANMNMGNNSPKQNNMDKPNNNYENSNMNMQNSNYENSNMNIQNSDYQNPNMNMQNSNYENYKMNMLNNNYKENNTNAGEKPLKEENLNNNKYYKGRDEY